MVGNGDGYLRDIILIVRFGKLVTNARMIRISVTARLPVLGHISGIDRHSNHIVSGWHYGLTIATVENKVLTAEKESISVRPARTDPLIAGNANCSTGTKFVIFRRHSIQPIGIGIGIQHAKTALRSLPHGPCLWIDELIQSVVAEMIVVMARRKFVETVIIGDVNIRIAERDIGIADIRSHDGESDNTPGPSRYTAFLDTTE